MEENRIACLDENESGELSFGKGQKGKMTIEELMACAFRMERIKAMKNSDDPEMQKQADQMFDQFQRYWNRRIKEWDEHKLQKTNKSDTPLIFHFAQ
jgi:hypothetical protein